MANIKKSLNLRHGLVVDDENFIVNANGLVGIGSTLPTEALDVGGNIRVRGTIISESNQFENATITDSITVDSLTANLRVISGITSISSGIITGYGGVLSYYGDGSNLDGLPTSQWKDIDVGLGYTSIFTEGRVGVGTINPGYWFQVGGNNDISNFADGVGITSTGSIFATGIVTAGSFSGTLSASDMTTGSIQDGIFDNVTVNINTSGIVTAGIFSGSISGSDITGGTIPNNVFGNVNTSGIITAASFSGVVTATDIAGIIPSNLFENINTTGIITAASFSGTVDGSNISSGIIPSNVFQDINISSGVVTATKFVGLGSNLTSLNPSEVQNISGGQYLPSNVFNDIIAEGDLTVKGAFDGSISTARGLSGTPSIDVNDINSSGIGSFADVEVRSTVAKVRVVGSTDAIVSIGQSDYGANEDISQFEYTDKTLNIYNYDLGGMDFSIHQGSFAGIDTGNYNWYYGKQLTTPLMTLTYGGKLGLGKTDADDTLHVVGTSTVTSNSFVGGDLKVYGNVNVEGTITGPFDSTVTLVNQINSSGFGTFQKIIATGADPRIGIGTLSPKTNFEVVGNALIESVGINTDNAAGELDVYGDAKITGRTTTETLRVTGLSTFTNIGINTNTIIADTGLHVNSGVHITGDLTANDVASSTQVVAETGFISQVGITTAVQITTEHVDDPNTRARVVFTVVGVGSTSLALY